MLHTSLKYSGFFLNQWASYAYHIWIQWKRSKEYNTMFTQFHICWFTGKYGRFNDVCDVTNLVIKTLKNFLVWFKVSESYRQRSNLIICFKHLLTWKLVFSLCSRSTSSASLRWLIICKFIVTHRSDKGGQSGANSMSLLHAQFH